MPVASAGELDDSGRKRAGQSLPDVLEHAYRASRTPGLLDRPHKPEEQCIRTTPRVYVGESSCPLDGKYLRTGEVVEFRSEEIERLQAEVARKLGYKLVDHRLELYAVPLDPATKTRR